MVSSCVGQFTSDIAFVICVVERELFQQIVSDTPGTSRFMQWKVNLMSIPVSTAIELTVSAVTEQACVVYQKQRFYMETFGKPEDTFSMLDVMLVKMVQDIVATPMPHVAGSICENVFCEECYK